MFHCVWMLSARNEQIVHRAHMDLVQDAGVQNAIQRNAEAADQPENERNRYRQMHGGQEAGAADHKNGGALERPEFDRVPSRVLFIGLCPGFQVPQVVEHLREHERVSP